MKELSFIHEHVESIGSTHLYLLNKLKNTSYLSPYLITTNNQTNSIGTHGKKWISLEGNLFFSLCFNTKYLPSDLKIESSSIYFSMVMKILLTNLGSNVTLKWPNDLYIDNKKIAGMLCSMVSNNIIISMGINIVNSPKNFEILDIKISPRKLMKLFIEEIQKDYSWKNIFNEFRIEFGINKNKTFYYNKKKYLLKDTRLCNDGSIVVENKKVYSIR